MRRLPFVVALAALILCSAASPSSVRHPASRLVGASEFGGARDHGVGCNGAGGDLCSHPWSFAELSNNPSCSSNVGACDFAALGHLRMHTKLLVCYHRCAVLEKRDVGAGAGFKVGTRQLRIDLWYRAADYLGIDRHKGVGIVRIKRTNLPLGKVKRNPPTKQPPPAAPVRAHGHRVDTNCAKRTLVLNDRGLCVRALQWLLAGNDPAVRPAKKARGANRDRRYWHLRSAPSGVYGLATVKQVQRAKYALGFPSQRANGAAGPKLRAYLLGTRKLPKAYVASEAKRYQAWKAQQHKGSDVKGLLRDAAYLIQNAGRIHYTQTMTGSQGRLSMLLDHPRGPPIAGELWADCSGSAEALFIWNGLPDPAGPGAYQRYPSAAVYTGSQVEHGRLVWKPGQSLSLIHPGDLLFFGSSHSNTTHVTVALGNGRAFSHGGEYGPLNVAYLYRSDVLEARRYVG